MGTTSEAARNRPYKGIRPNARSSGYGRKAREVALRHEYDYDGSTWELWEIIPGEGTDLSQHFDHGGAWSNYKLIALPTRKGKANYWLSYNHQECRFAKTRAAETLQNLEPVIYAWVLSAIDPDTYAGLV